MTAMWDNHIAGSSSTIADTLRGGLAGARPTVRGRLVPGGSSSMPKYPRVPCPECGRALPPNVVGRHLAAAHDPATFASRFWSRVDRRGPDECWEWQRNRLITGYGVYHGAGMALRSHRVAWELTNGPIPAGLFVCHTCDNPPCCNPAHLFLGTPKDNVDDKVAKGRAVGMAGDRNPARRNPERLARGARNGRHSRPGLTALVATDIPVIRARVAAGESQASVARAYRVGKSAIWSVVNRKAWKHLP